MILPYKVQIKITEFGIYTHKAHQLRTEIESYFTSIGLDTVSINDDGGDGSIIQDILVDIEVNQADTKSAIDSINRILMEADNL